MRTLEIKKTQFRVTDFLSWQRDGSLVLSPSFQRRPVWKPDAKSYFIDTVVRGLPAPIIYIREKLDLHSQRSIREVVDGQQRLRTVFSYIDNKLLKDFDGTRDRIEIRAIHNAEIAGKRFKDLSQSLQRQILEYEFSTHLLPINIEDREVLQMFARLNSTGVKLSHQELRNAQYFGAFKTQMYELALEQLERWRSWRIFNEYQIARMKEVEMTSDLAMNIIEGLTGKSQSKINRTYEKYDDKLPNGGEVTRRFRRCMEAIEETVGRDLRQSVYSSEIYFFTLFVYVYDKMYGLGSRFKKKSPRALSPRIRERLLTASNNFKTEKVPERVLDAVRRASADYGRRKTRLAYLTSICDA